MTNLTDKTELSTTPASGDFLHIVDVSDGTSSAEGTSKKITVSNLLNFVVNVAGFFNKSSETSDDITEGSTNLFMDTTEQSKLANVPANTNTELSGKADSSHTHTHADITDYDTELAGKTNTTAFTPTADYHVATKKYVDDNAGGTPEGTAILSTGEVGGSKFLREDGDGTCSWQAIPGGGDLLAANNLSDLANAATARTNLGVAIGSDVQAYDANLPTWPATVDATEVGYLNGVTSAIQTQIDAKLDTSDFLTGAGAPASTPSFEGQTYTDTTNDLTYIATGTASSADWKVQAAGTAGTPGKGSILAGDGSDSFDEVTAGSNDQIIVYDSAQGNGVKKVDLDSGINFVIDGGGSAITTGIKGDVEIPFDCTIEQVTMLADQTGSIVVDLWKDTYANFPPTDADTITASAVPTISSATKSQDGTLTGWTTALSAGDVLRYNVDSASTVERVTIALRVRRNF